MKQRLLHILPGILLCASLTGQSVLEAYIREGFQNNESIRQQVFALEKSVYALQEAKSLFMPKVVFMTDYFLAGGGRTVDFPAGDLLNPVYSSLNQLTNSNSFPQLDNQRILLNPNRFYDAKFRTTLPLLNREIGYNERIKEEQLTVQQLEIDRYKRELAKEIKVAYFQYLQSSEAVKIYDAALDLVREGKRINEVLLSNDKVNRTVVLRADYELKKLTATRENGVQRCHSAKAYFNFLLNRNPSDSILLDTHYQQAAVLWGDSSSVGKREELQQLALAATINEQVLGRSKSYRIPKVSAFLDLGSQGMDGQLNNQTAYYFLGISLQWDVFTGGRNALKVKQAALDSKMIESQKEYATAQLQLQFTTAVHDFQAALFAYEAALTAFTTAKVFYADMLRLYKEGQALFLELLDAQNQLVQAELQVNISLYDTYIKAALAEAANSSYNININ